MRMTIFVVLAVLSSSPAVATTINVLAFGQSNMEGRFGPAVGYKDPDPRIRVWNWKNNEWQIAELGVFPFWKARGLLEPANNLAYVFAKRLVDECSVNVDLTLLTSGGMRLEYFLPLYVIRKHGWSNRQATAHFGPTLSDDLLEEQGDL